MNRFKRIAASRDKQLAVKEAEEAISLIETADQQISAAE